MLVRLDNLAAALRTRTLLSLVVAGFFATSSAVAATDSLRTITERFVAPCCWRENLALHQSPDAERMRAEIVQLVAAGRTEDEIVERYVTRYGERILRVPRGGKFALLTLTPLAVLILGAAGVLLYLGRRRRAILPETAGVALPMISESELEW